MEGIGLLALNRGHYQLALKTFRETNDKSGMGKVYFKMGDYAQASACFEEANDNDALGDLYYSLRDFARAQECFLSSGNKVKALQALWGKKNLADAETFARRAIGEDEMVAELKLELGEIYRQQKLFDQARKEFQEVRAMEEMEEDALFGLARLEFDQKNYQAALDTYQTLRAKYPDTRYRSDLETSLQSIQTVVALKSKQRHQL